MEKVRLNNAGQNIIDSLMDYLRDDRATTGALTCGEHAILQRMLDGCPAPPAVFMVSGEDDEKPIICGDCGKWHKSMADVKQVRGSLVCVTGCGVVATNRRTKRPTKKM